MLRLFVLLLLLINGVYFAWAQHLLRPLGWGPIEQSEPQRLTQQIRPEAVRVLSAAEIGKVEAQAQADLAPKECLQAGPFDEAESAVLRRALESALPPGAWHLDGARLPERWIVYMGKFPTTDALVKKRAELNGLNLTLETVQNAALEPGLSLGGFETQAEANAHLQRLGQRGIRTARVVLERASAQSYQLKLPALTEANKARLQEVKAALAGKALSLCRP